MSEFRSGVLGAVICVVAIIGSILAGCCLDVSTNEVGVTKYDYITDVSGLFDISNAPEYIEYNPSTNFIGYTEQTMNYSNTLTPNTYRYVASSGLVDVYDYTLDNSASKTGGTPFQVGTLHNRNVLIDYTGSTYNLGTSETYNGTSYNIVASLDGNDKVKAAYLYDVILDNYTTSQITSNGKDIELTHSAYPAIMLPISSISTSSNNYGQNTLTYRHATITDSAFPTMIHVSGYSSTSTVTAYNGSTVLWTAGVLDILVIYDYGTMESGTYTHRNVQTTMTIDRVFTGTYTISDNTPVQDINTFNNDYAVTFLYDGGGYSFPAPILVGTDTYANGEVIKNTSNYYSVMSLTLAASRAFINGGGNITYYDSFTLTKQDNGTYPIFITKDGWTSYTIGGNPAHNQTMATADSALCDRFEFVNNGSISNWIVTAYKNNVQQWTKNVTGTTYIYVIYAYETILSTSCPINTTFTVSTDTGGISKTIDYSDSYTPYYNTVGNLIQPTIALNYTGTEYDLGTAITNPPLSAYNCTAMQYTSYDPDLGTAYFTKTCSLSTILSDFMVQNPINGIIDLSYPTTEPVFFCYGNWSETYVTLGVGTANFYNMTVDDDNIPDRITWDINNNLVTLYKDGVTVCTDNPDNIILVYDYAKRSGGSWAYAYESVRFQAMITSAGTTITQQITDSSEYTWNTTKFTPSNVGTTYINLFNTGYPLTEQYSDSLGEYYNITVNRTTAGSIHGHSAYSPKIAKLTDVISTWNVASYEKVTLNITQNGTYPTLFYWGDWMRTENISDNWDSIYFYAKMGPTNIPTKLEYTPATNVVKLYRGNNVVYDGLSDDVDVICQYNAYYGSFSPASVTTDLVGVGAPIPSYAYMDPQKGVTLRMGSTTWSNGYMNDHIDIVVSRDTSYANVLNELTITAGTSSVKIDIPGGSSPTMTATVTKYDGTSEVRTIGTWRACQITIDATDGTLSLTPMQLGSVSYTNNIELNGTTITWNGWYDSTLGTIESLLFSTSAQSAKFSVTDTTVFLDTYGTVMFDPSIDITQQFPDIEDWRLNFFSFAVVGDSITVNNQTFAVDDEQKITVTDYEGNEYTDTLANIYVTQDGDSTYLTFVNSGKTVDLGETVTDTVSFQGMWAFTTGLYEGYEGTEEVYDWNLDGALHADMTQIWLIFAGLIIAGMIVSRHMFGLQMFSIDGIILIGAMAIALIMAGGSAI